MLTSTEYILAIAKMYKLANYRNKAACCSFVFACTVSVSVCDMVASKYYTVFSLKSSYIYLDVCMASFATKFEWNRLDQRGSS